MNASITQERGDSTDANPLYNVAAIQTVGSTFSFEDGGGYEFDATRAVAYCREGDAKSRVAKDIYRVVRDPANTYGGMPQTVGIGMRLYLSSAAWC